MSDYEQQVLRALDTYKAAVLAKSVESFMQLYDPEVRVFDTWGAWSNEGAAAWQVAIEGWFSSLGQESVRVTFDDVRIEGEQGFASMSAIVTYTAMSAQGQELRAMQNRISWMLKAGSHHMRVIHERAISCEVEATKNVAVCKTTDRSVLGQMVDFGKALDFLVPEGVWGLAELRDAEDKLGDTPCRCSRRDEDIIWPKQKAVQLLEMTWMSSRVKH